MSIAIMQLSTQQQLLNAYYVFATPGQVEDSPALGDHSVLVESLCWTLLVRKVKGPDLISVTVYVRCKPYSEIWRY